MSSSHKDGILPLNLKKFIKTNLMLIGKANIKFLLKNFQNICIKKFVKSPKQLEKPKGKYISVMLLI